MFWNSLENIRLGFFIIFSIAIGFFLLVLPNLFVAKSFESEKMTSYECGFEPFAEGEIEIEVRFLFSFYFIYNF
jgi:NADH-quinone oxidoreductase subunit A